MARIPTIIENKEQRVNKSKVAPGPKIDRRFRGGSLDWIESGRWANVKSSNVKAIRYDRARKHLYVRFIGGNAEYRYYGVLRQTAEAMWRAASQGKFVWHVLRKKGYVFEKIK